MPPRAVGGPRLGSRPSRPGERPRHHTQARGARQLPRTRAVHGSQGRKQNQDGSSACWKLPPPSLLQLARSARRCPAVGAVCHPAASGHLASPSLLPGPAVSEEAEAEQLPAASEAPTPHRGLTEDLPVTVPKSHGDRSLRSSRESLPKEWRALPTSCRAAAGPERSPCAPTPRPGRAPWTSRLTPATSRGRLRPALQHSVGVG